VSGELVLPERGALAARTPAEVKAWAENVQEMRRAVLVEDVDYGVIPGTDRPTLYDAGAQKMAMLAGVGFTVKCIGSTDQGVTYHATVTRPDGFVLAESDGYAGFDEERFYQSAEHLRAKAERRERAYAAKDRRPVVVSKFAAEAFTDYRVPWNTLIKMAQKRARVGAISAALALGGLFEVADPGEDGADPDTGEIPRPIQPEASAAGAAVPDSRRSVERRRRPDDVPPELYDNLPEANR
jgi:hypothetical protein